MTLGFTSSPAALDRLASSKSLRLVVSSIAKSSTDLTIGASLAAFFTESLALTRPPREL